MNAAQFGEAVDRLNLIDETCDKISGITTTLKGIIVLEAKRVIPRGEFGPWLKKHFGKSKNTTAESARVARAFCESNPRVTFALLRSTLAESLDVLEQNRLDLGNPIVAQVAAWTANRSKYQLLLDLDPHRPGGNNHVQCPHCDADLRSGTVAKCHACGKATGFAGEPAVSAAEALAKRQEETRAAIRDLFDGALARGAWKLCEDDSVRALQDFYKVEGDKLAAWLRTPKKQRDAAELKTLA